MKTIIKTIPIIIFLALAGCRSSKVELEDKEFYSLLNTQYKNISTKEIPVFYHTISKELADIKEQMRFEKLNFNVTLSGELFSSKI